MLLKMPADCKNVPEELSISGDSRNKPPMKYRIKGKKLISFLTPKTLPYQDVTSEDSSSLKITEKISDVSSKSSDHLRSSKSSSKSDEIVYGGGSRSGSVGDNRGSLTNQLTLEGGQSAPSSGGSSCTGRSQNRRSTSKNLRPMSPVIDELSVPDDSSDEGSKEPSLRQCSSSAEYTNSTGQSADNADGQEFQILVDRLIDLAAARKYLLETQLLSNEDQIVQCIYSEMEKTINTLRCGGREAYSVIGCDRASLETTFERLLIRRNEREYYEELYVQILGILNQLMEYWKTDESQATIAMELLQDSCLKEMEPMCEGVRFIVKHLLLPEDTCVEDHTKDRIKKMYQTLIDIVRANKLKWVNLVKATKQSF